jgi:hypothetical protein
MHFTLVPEARTAGSALLVIPLRLERPAPGARITIPGPLVSCRQIIDTGSIRLTPGATHDSDMHLRFQLPRAVLPFKVEQARLVVKIDAPLRRVTISGRTDGGLVELHHVDSPLDPIHIEIGDERFLHVDEQGGLHINLSVRGEPNGGARPQDAQSDGKWTIEYVELEIIGRAE